MIMQDMRKQFVSTLVAMAEDNPDIVLINSDSQKVCGTAPFEEAFPERSYNVGIAEANMVSVAAGFSAFGKIPFVNSFTSFMTRRCFDQITVSLAYAGLSAVLVGTNPGIASELNGGTHMSFEDIGIMRTLPRMVIVEPCDAVQLSAAMNDIVKIAQPVYLRLFRGKARLLHDEGYRFQLGHGDVLRAGRDVTIIGSGMTVAPCLDAAQLLEGHGIDARVIDLHTLKPVDAGLIIQAAKETGRLVTVDNHNVIGGMGSAVAEVVTSSDCPVPVKRLGVQDRFGEVGKLPYLEKVFGLDAESIAAEVSAFVS